MAQTEQIANIPRHASPGATVFSVVLIAVTVLPLILIVLAPFFLPFAWGVDFFLAVASAHVLATAYLFTDRVNRRFVLNRPIQLIVIPILLFTGGVLVFMRPQNPVFVPALLLLFLYQTWHFGSQNIGVAMFISLSERGKAISPGEKNIIRMGTVCGMLGVLSALYPGFMIGQQYVHIDATPLAAIRFLHDVGTFVALALTGGALLLLLKAWHQRQFIYGAAIFLSVTFLFPMYISENYMIAVASFTIAHGLQYVVFLAAHSLSPPKSTRWRSFPFLAILIPPLILAGIVGTGHLIWTNAPTFQSDLLPLVGLSIILGLTLSHFWIDQFMWRMRNSERAKWVRQNYGFIFRSQ